jgi:hypothetical protein
MLASYQNLAPKQYAWGAAPPAVVPMPGTYKMG